MTDWEKLLTDVTAEVQRECGSVLSGADRAKAVGKGAAGDETLVADREAERLIVGSLLKVRDLRVLSEEAGELGPDSSRYVAIIDPLDGSSNFSKGIPFYCTSICIVEGSRLRDSRWAIVRNLVNGDVYYAERNKGAFKNGRPIRPSGQCEIPGSTAAVDISKAQASAIEDLAPLLSRLRRVVHLGANALEICLVADGTVDAFLDLRGRMRITDVAGAYLVAKEAGASLTAETGMALDPPFDLAGRIQVVAAATEALHRELLAELRGRTP